MPTKAQIQALNQSAEATDVPGQPELEPASAFDETKVKAKIQLIEDNVNKVIGKKGQNPHFWLNESVHPLVNRFLRGERTEELQSAILALLDSPPPIKINLGMTEEEQRRKYAELQREQSTNPVGLLMPRH